MDNARLAILAQLTIAALDETRAGLIVPTCYREAPDLDELLRIEQSYVPGTPPPSPPAGSWLAFVFSKPSIEQGKIHVHAFEPSPQGSASADEVWIKCKRAELVKELVEEAAFVDNAAAAMNQVILAWARAQVNEPAYSVVCDADIPIADGPTWLRTSIDIVRSGDRISVRVPVTQTPLAAPPRFAGMHYMKVVSPSWALRTLRGEAQ